MGHILGLMNLIVHRTKFKSLALCRTSTGTGQPAFTLRSLQFLHATVARGPVRAVEDDPGWFAICEILKNLAEAQHHIFEWWLWGEGPQTSSVQVREDPAACSTFPVGKWKPWALTERCLAITGYDLLSEIPLLMLR